LRRKNGKMEYWNIGLKNKYFGFSPLFHHSNIPLFQNFLNEGKDYGSLGIPDYVSPASGGSTRRSREDY
jgi:hypothetical protein